MENLDKKNNDPAIPEVKKEWSAPELIVSGSEMTEKNTTTPETITPIFASS